MKREAFNPQRASCRGGQSPSARRSIRLALRLAHYGKTCRNSDKEPNKTKVKKENVRKLHVVLIQSAVDKLSREELNRAKYGLEFADRPTPVNLIEPVRKVEPMRFSLANLLPVGV